MRERRPCRLSPFPALPALLTLFLAAATAELVVAQDDEAHQHGIFLDSLDVALVNLEVIVTTRDGTPVTDLGPDDFEVRDDGELVEITNFFRVEGGRRLDAIDGDGMEAAAAAALAADAIPAPREPTSVILLVDDAFIGAASRKRIFNAIREELDALLADGARVMVVHKDLHVRVEQRFTGERVKVEEALARLERIAGSGVQDELEERSILRQIDLAYDPAAAGGGGGDSDPGAGELDPQRTYLAARSYAQQIYNDVRRSVGLMVGFLDGMAGLPGRKALIYAADRLPQRPGEVIFRSWSDRFAGDFGATFDARNAEDAINEFDTSSELRELAAHATASRVTFYPVSSRLSRANRALSAETSNASTGFLTQNLHSETAGLTYLAQATGGQAAVGAMNVGKLLGRLRQDLGHYYSLGYPSPHRGDGKNHDVQVRVKRPGVRVSTIETYRDKSGADQMVDRTLASLYLDRGENPLEVQVELGRPERLERKEFEVPVQVRFPLKRLVLIPQETAHVGNVSIVLIVRDSEGRLSEPARRALPIEIPNDKMLLALTQAGVYDTRLRLRPGPQTLAVGVRDELGATSSTVHLELKVGGAGGVSERTVSWKSDSR